MFIFRSISGVLSVIGYILAAIILFFGFAPLKYPTQPEIKISKILQCESTTRSFALNELNNDSITDLKSDLGSDAPIELLKDFMTSIDSVSSTIGATPKLSVESCDVSDTSAEALNKINQTLEKSKKYYEYGLFDDFVKSINELPFAKVSNVELKVDSTFARANLCNQPINRTKMYLFTVLPTTSSGINKAVSFNISLEQVSPSTLPQDFLGNVLISGQYIKAQIRCNG